MRYLWLVLLPFLVSCTGTPKGIEPIDNFDLNRYLGDWYEIARLDHSFERGLSNIKANYSLNKDGSVKVINTGFSEENGEWKEAIGKAKFVKNPDIGHLKVSFFGPFYGSYVIFRLDEDYQYAFITSHNRDFLWLLSRSPDIDESVKQGFINTIKGLGFNTDELIYVDHSPLGSSN